ncbi:hypothetical protein RRG08_012125 [Elysia crispata]|uniref:Uncharacterized protein n=1 Tax=Elysia crispata TaxID=231223 RepID=A0AAE1E0J9_9GAST|nr:hypothetical protein RRG08_012125 [Elysia crispata]
MRLEATRFSSDCLMEFSLTCLEKPEASRPEYGIKQLLGLLFFKQGSILACPKIGVEPVDGYGFWTNLSVLF